MSHCYEAILLAIPASSFVCCIVVHVVNDDGIVTARLGFSVPQGQRDRFRGGLPWRFREPLVYARISLALPVSISCSHTLGSLLDYFL
jgi:hypothetical protein